MALAFVSRVAAHPASGSTSTLTAAATSHTAGNALLVLVYGGTTSFTATVSDTAGNTFTNLFTDTDGPGFYACYEAHNITGNASNVVQAVLSTGQVYPVMVVHEVSGFGANTPDETHGFGNSTSDGSANCTFTSLAFSGSEAYVLSLANAAFEGGTGTVGHSGATTVVYGEDTGDNFQYFKETRHIVSTSPHACGINLGGTGVGQPYWWGSVAFEVGSASANEVLMAQGVM